MPGLEPGPFILTQLGRTQDKEEHEYKKQQWKLNKITYLGKNALSKMRQCPVTVYEVDWEQI